MQSRPMGIQPASRTSLLISGPIGVIIWFEEGMAGWDGCLSRNKHPWKLEDEIKVNIRKRGNKSDTSQWYTLQSSYLLPHIYLFFCMFTDWNKPTVFAIWMYDIENAGVSQLVLPGLLGIKLCLLGAWKRTWRLNNNFIHTCEHMTFEMCLQQNDTNKIIHCYLRMQIGMLSNGSR